MNIPDGWQLVPKEPDDSMLLQANCGVSKTYDKKHGHIIGCTVDFRNSYKAMLSAAPSAPSVDKPSEEIIREQRGEWPDRQEGWPVVRPVADARNEGDKS
jgi:hypothetical protein